MSYPMTAITRAADQRIEDEIRQSPVDAAQYATHHRILKVLVAPWLWCVAIPWLTSGTLQRYFADRK